VATILKKKKKDLWVSIQKPEAKISPATIPSTHSDILLYRGVTHLLKAKNSLVLEVPYR